MNTAEDSSPETDFMQVKLSEQERHGTARHWTGAAWASTGPLHYICLQKMKRHGILDRSFWQGAACQLFGCNNSAVMTWPYLPKYMAKKSEIFYGVQEYNGESCVKISANSEKQFGRNKLSTTSVSNKLKYIALNKNEVTKATMGSI